MDKKANMTAGPNRYLIVDCVPEPYHEVVVHCFRGVLEEFEGTAENLAIKLENLEKSHQPMALEIGSGNHLKYYTHPEMPAGDIERLKISYPAFICQGVSGVPMVTMDLGHPISHDGELKVIGIDTDGCLICQGGEGEPYNCGETLEQFGIENLTPEEKSLLGLEPQQQL